MATKKVKRATPSNRESGWIDIHDDKAMLEAGFYNRAPGFERDPSIWTKTPAEKAAIAKARRKRFPGFTNHWGGPWKSIPCYDKLIVTIWPISEYTEKVLHNVSKTVLSFKCGQSDIPRILSHLCITYTNKAGEKQTRSVVRKYKWLGKEYQPNELPFYY